MFSCLMGHAGLLICLNSDQDISTIDQTDLLIELLIYCGPLRINPNVFADL